MMDNSSCFLSQGSWFIIHGVWLLCQVLQRYFLCSRPTAEGVKTQLYITYRSKCSYTFSPCPEVPIEGIMKVVAFVFVMTEGLFLGHVKDPSTRLEHAQHSMVFFFFCLNGVVDVFKHRRICLPSDMDYATLLLAFCIEALVIYHDLHGRRSLDTQMHVFLLYLVIACAVSTFLEMSFEKKVLPALARGFFTLLQGSWMYQIWYVLKREEEWDITPYSLITLIFTWHIALIFIFTAMAAVFVNHRTRTQMEDRRSCNLQCSVCLDTQSPCVPCIFHEGQLSQGPTLE